MASRKARNSTLEATKLVSEIRVYAPNELKEVLGQVADKENLPLSEFVVRIMAQHIGRPDLGIIPRKKMGRPRKDLAAQQE